MIPACGVDFPPRREQRGQQNKIPLITIVIGPHFWSYGAFPFPRKLDIFTDCLQSHSCLFKTHYKIDPVQSCVIIIPDSRSISRHFRNQPYPLIVAEIVNRYTCFSDASLIVI